MYLLTINIVTSTFDAAKVGVGVQAILALVQHIT